MKLYLPFILILITFSYQLIAQNTNCRQADSLVLVSINNSITNLNWDTNTSINTWNGIFLNEYGCVDKLDLSNKNLNGTVAQEINNFAAIRYIDLSDNNLTGIVLRNITNHWHIDTLNLANNQFIEELPTDVKFKSNNPLLYLNISNNSFSGDFRAFFTPYNLRYLNIANNQLSGESPFYFYGRETEEMYAQNNLFEGDIPYQLSTYLNLKVLDLSGNLLTGEIPYQLSNRMPELLSLNLEDNLLIGCLHKNLRRFCDITVSLDFGNNFDSSWSSFCAGEANCGIDPNCTVSDSLNLIAVSKKFNCGEWDEDLLLTDWKGVLFNNLSCITQISLYEDDCNGFLPPEIGNFTKLKKLYIDENHLTKPIPPEIGNLTNLEVLSIEDCSGLDRTGIPPEIGKLKKLKYLNLRQNSLGGEIPEEITKLCNLETLNLEANSLSGSLPATMGNLSKLENLFLHINNLTEPLPESFKNLNNLKKIDFSQNNFSRDFPMEFMDIKNIEKIDVSYNQLTGSIPSTIENLSQLEYLSIRSNQLTGEIPDEILNLDNLQYLYASYNQLSGCFNSSLSTLCDIASFDKNNFEGSWDNFCKFGVSGCDEIIPCRSNDSLSLLGFYQSVSGLSWDIAQPVTNWEGVSFDANGCVNKLTLPAKNLSGTVGNDLEKIKYLKEVDLSNNKLNFLFYDFGDYEFSNIEILDLSSNLINSGLSNIGRDFKNLKYLDLSNNLIEYFRGLSNFNYQPLQMQYLDLSNNKFEGEIPLEYTEFVYFTPNIYYFNISKNNFSGDFPSSFLNLCDRLAPQYSSNTYLSDGTNLNTSWEDFCNSQISNNCIDDLSLINSSNSIIYENVYEANSTVSLSQKVESNANITLKANEEINLYRGTFIDASTNFSATIGACE